MKDRMNSRKVVMLVPRAREKGTGKDPLYLYLEPALVSRVRSPRSEGVILLRELDSLAPYLR